MFLHSDFDEMYFSYTAKTKLLAYMKRGGGGGGVCFDKEQEFHRLVLHLLGEERQSHWAFINKA